MTSSIISSRYARSLFDLAIEIDLLEKVNNDMSLVEKVCKENMLLNTIMMNPNVNIGKKKSIIKDIFASNIEKISFDFIILLIQKRRVILLKEISEEFHSIYNKYKGIKVSTLIVAQNVEQKIKDKIISILEKEFSCKIELVEKIDRTIIGGFKIMIEDRIYDASVSNQLSLLKKSFAKNLYEKGF